MPTPVPSVKKATFYLPQILVRLVSPGVQFAVLSVNAQPAQMDTYCIWDSVSPATHNAITVPKPPTYVLVVSLDSTRWPLTPDVFLVQVTVNCALVPTTVVHVVLLIIYRIINALSVVYRIVSVAKQVEPATSAHYA